MEVHQYLKFKCATRPTKDIVFDSLVITTESFLILGKP